MKKINWTPEVRKKLRNISNLPQHRFEQGNPDWSEHRACCFGAHLANEFKCSNKMYLIGLSRLERSLGLTSSELDYCFSKAGALAPHGEFEGVFEGDAWPIPAKEVIENFLDMTHVPEGFK